MLLAVDICLIVAHEIAATYDDLDATASKVDFVSVNVNAGHSSPATVVSFVHLHGNGIGTVPNFYYVTGRPGALRPVWTGYGIIVHVNNGKVFHSEGLYFIAPGGVVRYQATPFANMREVGNGRLPPATIAQWGKGIAKYAEKVAG
ncbi:MAG: SCO family protein [Acidimicrobiales bacterium]